MNSDPTLRDENVLPRVVRGNLIRGGTPFNLQESATTAMSMAGNAEAKGVR